MTRLLFDPSDMLATAGDLARASGDMIQTGARLAVDLAAVMPPAIAAEAAMVTASVEREVTAAAGFYSSQSAELTYKAATIEAQEGAKGLLSSPLARWLEGECPMLGGPAFGNLRRVWEAALGSPATRAAAFNALRSVYDSGFHELESFAGDALDTEITIGKLAGNPTWNAGARALEADPVVRAFGAVNTALGYIDDAQAVSLGWKDSQGEALVGRGFTVATTGVADVAIDRNPVAAGANALSLNSIKADVSALSDMGGAGISGFISGTRDAIAADRRDIARGDLLGAVRDTVSAPVEGAITGADQALGTWSTEVSHGAFGTPLKWIAAGENWTIDRVYGPVAGASTALLNDVGNAESGAAHLLRRAASALIP
jgi:hypothetical protein